MQVVMLTPFGLVQTGGISRYVDELSDSLRTMGIGCRVIVRDGPSHPEDLALPGPKPIFALRALLWLIRNPPDVIHAHAHWYTLLPAVVSKFVNGHAKIIFTFHTPLTERDTLASILLRLLVNQCDIVTAPSSSYLQSLRHSGMVVVPTVAVPPGSTLRTIDYESARSKLAVSPSTFLVTFIGPLVWPEKAAGVALLLKAYRDFAQSWPACKLIIVGGGPFLGALEASADSLGLHGQVRFVGRVENVSPYLDACDAYAHISFREGVPLSILDALSAAKPVIASRVGGIPELITQDETGILVENNATSIRNALDRLAGDASLRLRLGERGRASVESSHTWTHVAEQFVTLYQEGRLA